MVSQDPAMKGSLSVRSVIFQSMVSVRTPVSMSPCTMLSSLRLLIGDSICENECSHNFLRWGYALSDIRCL